MASVLNGECQGEVACAHADTHVKAPFVQSLATVVAHEAVSSRYYHLKLRCPEVASRALPGQFVMLACAPDNAGVTDPLLPRPFAVLDARDGVIELLYFVAGRGTEVLRTNAEAAMNLPESKRKPLRIIGPLGRGFEPIPDVDVHIALGGGSGVAPLVYFFRQFAKQNPEKWTLILAARSANQLAREDVVSVPGKMIQATDDGSSGFKGNAVGALNELLNGPLSGLHVGIYAAGPEPMMEAAAKVASSRNLPAVVSLEGRMACGVGVCRACVVDGVTPHPKSGLMRRAVCLDGPVFDIKALKGWS